MARIIYGPNQTVLNFDDNRMVAHIQALTHARFMTGLGFFMTLCGSNDDGEQGTAAHWFHPEMALRFEYDVVGDFGEYVDPISIDQEFVDRNLGYLDAPLGFIGGFDANGPYLPFAPPVEPETVMPVVGPEEALPEEQGF